MQLFSLADYVQASRVLLQDLIPPYRYDDESLVTTLNMAFYEAMRLRPDLLLDGKYQTISVAAPALNNYGAPVFTVAVMSDPVPVPPSMKMPFLYFMVGQAQLRDLTDTQDSRASAFLNKFITQLTSLQA